MENHRLRVLKTEVLRKIFGPKRKKKNEMVRRMASVRTRRDTYRILVGKSEIKRPLRRLRPRF